MLDQLPAAGHSVNSREHAWIGRRVDDPIDLRDRFEIARGTEIGMAHGDTALAQRLEVELASSATQIVQPDDLAVRDVVEQAVRERATHEAANAGNKNLHRRVTRFISIRLNKGKPKS